MPKPLSPLRYPGGKAKLAPLIQLIIKNQEAPVDTYIEPFAGGAGVALHLLFTGSVNKIIINDFDPAIYALWRQIITNPTKLCSQIETAQCTIEEWKKQKSIISNENSPSDKLAFATLFLNRTSRSGILGAGPIGGFSQNGEYKLDARFNKQTLIDRITAISNYSAQIEVLNLEVRELLASKVVETCGTFIYLDPPYYINGNRLYLNSLDDSDHKEISEAISNLPIHSWVLTYDNCSRVQQLYKDMYRRELTIHYTAASHSKGTELLIYNDQHIDSIIASSSKELLGRTVSLGELQ